MGDTVEDDDKWLYGGSESNLGAGADNSDTGMSSANKHNDDLSQIFENQLFDEPNTSQEADSGADQSVNHIKEEERDFSFDATDKEMNSEANVNNDEEDSEEEDDDDVQVTIGDIKANTTFGPYGAAPMNLNITKRTANFVAGQTATAAKPKAGLDIDAVGTYNGVPIYDVNLDSLEEKPWRKPGADITDYFNYGFNEEMWKLYCERQKKLRSNDFLTNGPPQTSKPNPPFAGATPPVVTVPGKPGAEQTIPIASVNENSKYTGLGPTKKAGPPPGRKQSGTIDVIGGGTPTTPSMLPSRRPPDTKENFIQVIGNRPPGPPPPGMPPGLPFPPPPGMSMPPPFFPPPGVEMPPGMPPPPGLPFIPGPNGQPLPFPPGDFPRMPFPHPGMMPHQEHHFDEQEGFHEGMRGSPNGGREDERERDRDRDRDYHRSSRGYSREFRDDESYRGRHYREREYEHHERSRDRDDYESRRHRERDTKEREREKGDRDRDRERDRDRDRDRERGESSSRRRHREEDEESSRSSSSRHKHSKRSKRDKEEEEKESKH